MRVVATLWLAFVVAMSMMPLKLKDRVGTTGVMHNPGHFLVFFITAILLCRTAPNFGSRLLRLAGICCFGVLMEILETVAFHNTLEWQDMLIDFLGAAVGLAVVSIFRLQSGTIQEAGISRSRNNL